MKGRALPYAFAGPGRSFDSGMFALMACWILRSISFFCHRRCRHLCWIAECLRTNNSCALSVSRMVCCIFCSWALCCCKASCNLCDSLCLCSECRFTSCKRSCRFSSHIPDRKHIKSNKESSSQTHFISLTSSMGTPNSIRVLCSKIRKKIN